MGYLNEELFSQQLWHHSPLTDIWMIGAGTANHLARLGITDLYGITQFPEHILYREFGINAEILIDHAWGKESVEIKDIKAYQPKAHYKKIMEETIEEQMTDIITMKMLDVYYKTLKQIIDDSPILFLKSLICLEMKINPTNMRP